MSKNEDNIYLSIVLPIYNEEQNISLIHDQITKALKELNRPYEIIMVDDGSRDNSYSELVKVREKDQAVRIVKFRRNFGQTAAMAAGIDYSKGEVIITLDADLQNDPKDIPKLLTKLDEGYDVVSGWRKNRKDKGITRKLPSKIANRLISKITGVVLNDYGCTLKAYRADVIKKVSLYGELHRFIPVLINMVGMRYTEIVVDHHARQYGTSKYGLNRTIRVVLDLITLWFLENYRTRPMQYLGKWGVRTAIIGFISWLATLVMRIATGFDITGNPFFLIGFFFILASMQLFGLGLIGEMVTRVYHEKDEERKIYVVEEVRE